MTEEEIKLNYITPAIEKAGWDRKLIRMEYPITAGKIVVRGDKAFRLTKKEPTIFYFTKRNCPMLLLRQRMILILLAMVCCKRKNTLIN